MENSSVYWKMPIIVDLVKRIKLILGVRRGKSWFQRYGKTEIRIS